MNPAHDTDYRPDIDGLRAVAVLAVVGFHAWPGRLAGGFVGVDVFFVISGFLISGIIIRAIEAGKFSYAEFYARRIRRIFPALIVVLIATAMLGWWMLLPMEFEQLGRHVAAGALFASNFQLWSEAGYFDTAAETKPLLHLWSLGIEEQFYLIWPFVLVWIWRAGRGRITSIAIIAAVSFALNVAFIHRAPSATFYLPFTRFWELLLGAILAAAHARAPSPTPILAQLTRSPRARNMTSLVGGALIAYAVLALHPQLAFPGWWALLPAGGTALIVAGGPGAWLNRMVLSRKVLVEIGLISYPLYLWHWPLLAFVRIADLEDPAMVRWLKLAALAIAGLAALLTYRSIELRVRRRPASGLAIPLGAGMAITALVGLSLVTGPRLGPRTTLAENPFVRIDSLERSASCASRFRMPDRFFDSVFCASTDSSSTPEVVLIGDSHASAMWPGVATAFAPRGALLVGARSCPFVRNTRAWTSQDPGNRERCPALMDAAYRVLEGRPRTVILVARWAYYTTGEGFGATEVGQDPRFISDEMPGATAMEVYRAGLERETRFLLAAGHEVLLVQPTPELGFSPRRCLHLRATDALRGNETCTVSRDAYEARQGEVRQVAAEVVAAIGSPRLSLLDPASVLCDKEACHAMIGETMLYRDDDHLSRAGAEFLWAKLLEQRDSRSRDNPTNGR